MNLSIVKYGKFRPMEGTQVESPNKVRMVPGGKNGNAGLIRVGSAPGNTPGSGRPKKTEVEARERIRQEVERQAKQAARELVESAISQAQQGNVSLWNSLTDRAWGKVETKVEVSLSGSFQDGMIACLSQLADLLAGNLDEAVRRLKLLESDAQRALALRDALDAEFTEVVASDVGPSCTSVVQGK